MRHEELLLPRKTANGQAGVQSQVRLHWAWDTFTFTRNANSSCGSGREPWIEKPPFRLISNKFCD